MFPDFMSTEKSETLIKLTAWTITRLHTTTEFVFFPFVFMQQLFYTRKYKKSGSGNGFIKFSAFLLV